jgi:transcriptional regulator with XRE-family HTH domain
MAKAASAEGALAQDAGVIGPQLRTSREEAGISVRELARRTGLSPSLISQVENGKVLPSLATLFKLTNELGTRVNTMIFGENRAPAHVAEPESARMPVAARRVVKRGEGERIVLNSGVNWERLTPTADMEADFLHVVYEPGGSSCEGQEFMRHNGREYGHILSGTLKVTIGFEEHLLRQGDSISFDSTLPHRLETVGEKPVHAIWFVTGRNARG